MTWESPITHIDVRQRGLTAHMKIWINGKAAGTLLATKQEAAEVIALLTAKPEPALTPVKVVKPKAKRKPRRAKQTTTIKKIESDLGLQFRPVKQE